MYDRVRTDVRQGIRSLVSRPGFTAAAILSLAVGIGINATAFSLLNAMVFRPLPGIVDEDRLASVGLSVVDRDGWSPPVRMAYPDFRALADRTDLFTGVAAAASAGVAVDAGAGPGVEEVEYVTPNYFRVLGTRPEAGRFFSPGSGEEAEAAVVAHRFWRRSLSADPRVVGRRLAVGPRRVTVVGVAPEGFTGMNPADVVEGGGGPALWLTMEPAEAGPVGASGGVWTMERRWIRAVARLRDGVDRDAAERELASTALGLAEDHPEREGASFALGDLRFGPGASPSRGLLVVVGFMVIPLAVLLIACANVAGLFLARGLERRRELAVRAALGASRGRLFRQLLTEGLLVAGVGGILGLVVAVWAKDLAAAFAVHLSMGAPVDLRVVAFAFAVTVGTALAFGVAPAFRASREDPSGALAGGARAGATAGALRFRKALVAGQVTLSLVLLVACGLFVRTTRAGSTVETGFAEDDLLLATVDFDALEYDAGERAAFQRRLLEGLGTVPGISAASGADRPPLAGLGSARVATAGRDVEHGPRTSVARVDGGFFGAAGVDLRSGRGFRAGEAGEESGVAVVNEALAAELWPGETALGRALRVGSGERTVTVVGVAADTRARLARPPEPIVYLPRDPGSSARWTAFVRTAGRPAAVAPAVRRLVGSIDPRLPVARLESMATLRERELLPERLAVAGMGALAAIALLLAATGLHATMAFTVARRRHEIGVRMAVGASRARVMGAVLRSAGAVTLTGIGIGGLAAGGLASLVRTTLFGVSALDPLTFGATAGLLVIVALAAAAAPAWRAAAVDPVRTLAAE